MTQQAEKPVVNLSECDGNAYAIIGRCIRVAREANWDEARMERFQNDATSGDYDHVLQTAMKFFKVV